MIADVIKLMRLPFLSASVIPYLIGLTYCLHKGEGSVSGMRALLGFLLVVSAHIGANILNDYFDSKSGNDWQDRRKHLFFGGSKVIQNGLLTERFALKTAVFFLSISTICITILQLLMKDVAILPIGLIILFLAVSYTAPPLKLAYRGLGEAAIFLLFGPAIVAGASTIATGRYFGINEILLALPIAFLVTAIIFCNEVADYNVDKAVNKNTLAVLIGPEKAFWLYAALIDCAIISLVICVALKILPAASLFLILLLLGLFIRPTFILKNEFNNIERLKIVSKLTILGHSLFGLGVMLTLSL